MATYSKIALSGSTDGKSILITDTATAGQTIHTAHATNLDEIWIYAYNSDTVQRKVTIEWGAATSPLEQTIPAESGAYLCVPGWLLTNSQVVAAFAETGSVISINGFVNRIS